MCTSGDSLKLHLRVQLSWPQSHRGQNTREETTALTHIHCSSRDRLASLSYFTVFEGPNASWEAQASRTLRSDVGVELRRWSLCCKWSALLHGMFQTVIQTARFASWALSPRSLQLLLQRLPPPHLTFHRWDKMSGSSRQKYTVLAKMSEADTFVRNISCVCQLSRQLQCLPFHTTSHALLSRQLQGRYFFIAPCFSSGDTELESHNRELAMEAPSSKIMLSRNIRKFFTHASVISLKGMLTGSETKPVSRQPTLSPGQRTRAGLLPDDYSCRRVAESTMPNKNAKEFGPLSRHSRSTCTSGWAYLCGLCLEACLRRPQSHAFVQIQWEICFCDINHAEAGTHETLLWERWDSCVCFESKLLLPISILLQLHEQALSQLLIQNFLRDVLKSVKQPVYKRPRTLISLQNLHNTAHSRRNDSIACNVLS